MDDLPVLGMVLQCNTIDDLEILFCPSDGYVDHHCLEVVFSFVDIGGIVDHHCLEVVFSFVDIGRFVDHHYQYQQS
jgi:hypothetical protein